MTIISLNMVQSFDVGSKCKETCPCQHDCKITLTDGREKTVSFSASKIYPLITSLAQKNIVNYDATVKHFSYMKKYHGNNALQNIFTDNKTKLVDIQKFTVGAVCDQLAPCSHPCTITLNDGTEKKVTLKDHSIDDLITSLAKEKVDCGFIHHFADVKKFYSEKFLTYAFKGVKIPLAVKKGDDAKPAIVSNKDVKKPLFVPKSGSTTPPVIKDKDGKLAPVIKDKPPVKTNKKSKRRRFGVLLFMISLIWAGVIASTALFIGCFNEHWR